MECRDWGHTDAIFILRGFGSVMNQPEVPVAWRSEFANYQRQLALRLGVVGSFTVVVLLPLVQLLDFYVILDDASNGARVNALWRLPGFLMAALFLMLALLKPDGLWPRPLLCLLSATLVIHAIAIAILRNAPPGPGADYAVDALVLVILALAPAAIGGLRDIVVTHGIPFVIGVVFILFSEDVFAGEPLRLMYPAMALFISAAIAELLNRGHVETFLAHQQLREFAMTDPLTGLLNRRAMDHRLAVEMARNQRHGTGFAVVMMDLDHFKRVNDTHGHDVGDEVLRRLAVRIREVTREDDAIARWGGEEFLLMVHSSDSVDAAAVAEKVRDIVAARPFRTSAGELPITISLGVAIHEGTETVEQTVARADKALYQAKADGRNRVVVANS